MRQQFSIPNSPFSIRPWAMPHRATARENKGNNGLHCYFIALLFSISGPPVAMTCHRMDVISCAKVLKLT